MIILEWLYAQVCTSYDPFLTLTHFLLFSYVCTHVINYIFLGTGLSTKGFHACPFCVDELDARYSRDLNKVIYPHYRRFLPADHPFRSRDRRQFNGLPEQRPCPHRMTPKDWEDRWDAQAEGSSSSQQTGSKLRATKSIFYRLEYWRSLKITHLLDPMHIFKNVADQLWRHLNGERDTTAARRDLVVASTKQSLWPTTSEAEEAVSYEHAPWVLTNEEMRTVITRIKDLRTPTGYGASFRSWLSSDGHQLSRLKSHDWHNMLQVWGFLIMFCFLHYMCVFLLTHSVTFHGQHILPLVIGDCLTEGVRNIIYLLGELARYAIS